MSGFNFGSTSGGGATSGFSFGTPAAATPGAAPTQASAAPAPGGFSFGTPAAGSTGAFSFGGQSAVKSTTAAPTSGFSFGAPAANPATATPLSQSSSGGFTLGATTAAAAPKPGGFSFGTVAAAAPAPTGSTSTAAPSTGFSFGAAASTPQQPAAATAAKPAGLSFGASAPAAQPSTGFTFGTTPAAAPAATLPPQQKLTFATPVVPNMAAPVTSKPATGITFGTTPQGTGTSLGGLTKPTTQSAAPGMLAGLLTTSAGATTAFNLTGSASKPTTTPVVAPGGGFTLAASSAPATAPSGFGLKPTTAASLTTATPAATTTATSGLTFNLPASTAATTLKSTAVSLSTATTTTASTAQPLPAMNYRQLEEAINKWTLELEEQEKMFLQQATQVNAWDRLLIENGDKITQLNIDVEKVKHDQKRLDHELDFIQSQQKELEEMLTPIEKAVEELPPIGYSQHADLEREHTYQLAENIDAQLKRMVGDLKEIVEHLNTSNSSQDSSDPIYQIARILNAHMDSLQWVDQNSAMLQRKVDEISKLAETRRIEQEKNFRLAYD
ncbi:uncharacterized protein LOC141912608 [Tubulanus polymorphus]|uniref:uncharacterized protein LOC141912608 n=1 Tax=Tubulanus polymorphus TaxID=672921 RepID=UPI003DA5EAF2